MSVSSSASAAAATTAAFRAAIERTDLDATLACCAPGIILHSPITDQTHFAGHDEVRPLIDDVFRIVEDFHYTQDFGDEEWRALFATARIAGVRVDQTIRVRLDADARIAEVWLYFRPLPGLMTLLGLLAQRVGNRRGRLHGLLAALLIRPVALLTRVGDRPIVRLVGLPKH